ncbi:MAG TPA: TonB C-terminal domain-containing protein [Telluria sp.]
MSTAMVVSVLFHALLLSVTFGGQEFGLPGLNLPWKERRLGADDLRILLAPAQPPAPTPTPAPESTAANPPRKMANAVRSQVDKPAVANKVAPVPTQPAAIGLGDLPAVSIPSLTPAPAPAIARLPPPMAIVTPVKRPAVNLPIAPDTPPTKAPVTSEAPTIPMQRSEVVVPSKPSEEAQKQIERAAREKALEKVRLEQETQNAEKLRQAELTANAQRESERLEKLRQDAARAEQTARSEAARMEAQRQELARQEALRQETLQQERARQEEKAQQDAARQELQRTEAARVEAERKEATRQEQVRQAQLDAARQAQLEADRKAQIEAARQAELAAAKQAQAKLDGARQEAIKQEAARRDATTKEAARQDAARQEAARQEQARLEQAQRERAEQEAQREERLRAIGKQLNEEAAKRNAALNRPSPALPPTTSSLRRGWLFGRADANVDLVLYGEAMSRKIEQSMTFDMVREAVKQPHARPTVTVAVRSDGSVEKVTFEVSSGVPAIDEAIRKVIASQAPYPAFSPALARQYDVIEVRRTWVFDMAIRLQ